MAQRGSEDLSRFEHLGQMIECHKFITSHAAAYSPAWSKAYNAVYKKAERTGIVTSRIETILIQAVEAGWKEVIESILQSCTNANNENDKKTMISTMLQYCRKLYSNYELYSFMELKNNRTIRMIYKAILKKLSDRNFTEFSTNGGNIELVHAAIFSESPTMLEKLLDNCANFDILHFAVLHNRVEIVKLLLERGANVNLEDAFKQVPIFYAIRNGNADIMTLLLEKGAKIVGRAELLKTAILMGNREIIDILFDNDEYIDVNACGNDGIQPLHCTALHKFCVFYLGGNRDELYDRLDEATVVNEKVKIARFLLNAGADVNARGIHKNTTLHLAARNGNVELVKTLLERNADVNMNSYCGNKAIDRAIQNNHLKIVKILLKYGSDIECTNSYSPFVENLEMRNIIKEHLLKLMALDRHVTENWLQWMICHMANPEGFLKGCKYEIAIMKREMIGDSIVSYWDILAKDINKLTMLTRNESIVDTLATGVHRRRFRIYSKLIDTHFGKGLKRAALIDSSSEIIRWISQSTGNEITDSAIEKVLSYMEKQDLRNLIEAWKMNE